MKIYEYGNWTEVYFPQAFHGPNARIIFEKGFLLTKELQEKYHTKQIFTVWYRHMEPYNENY